ncbi:MAG TPA: radical SAM protein [Candidatus Acidoferrales bacterium]|nr:radical SAM protein [Candidatus Acidoferrales bacterium]
MSALMAAVGARAQDRGIPLSAHLDLTYRCNERCVHCYLDHSDHGELSTAEILDLLDQMAAAGVLFLTISGGEIFLRRDFFEILESARAAAFCVRLKTNGVMIREAEARQLADLHIESVQISIYSDRAEVHDEITKLPGSLARSLRAVRLLRENGIRVTVANVAMSKNFTDYHRVQDLSARLGAHFALDPTVTPMMDGNRSVLDLGIDDSELREVFRDESLVRNAGESCAPPSTVTEGDLDSYPCSAGHTACYISPYGDVYPCVQFPLACGNIRQQRFVEVWRDSPQMNEVRSIRLRDLSGCSSCVHGASCSRCPGLAFMEGNMRGPSTLDCRKSFARTGISSENLRRKRVVARDLVQIEGIAMRENPARRPEFTGI